MLQQQQGFKSRKIQSHNFQNLVHILKTASKITLYTTSQVPSLFLSALLNSEPCIPYQKLPHTLQTRSKSYALLAPVIVTLVDSSVFSMI